MSAILTLWALNKKLALLLFEGSTMTDYHVVEGPTTASVDLSSGNTRDLQMAANASDSQPAVITVELSVDPASVVRGSVSDSNDPQPTVAESESLVMVSNGDSNDPISSTAESESVVADASDLEMTVENLIKAPDSQSEVVTVELSEDPASVVIASATRMICTRRLSKNLSPHQQSVLHHQRRQKENAKSGMPVF